MIYEEVVLSQNRLRRVSTENADALTKKKIKPIRKTEKPCFEFTSLPNLDENGLTTRGSNFNAEAFGDMFSTLYNQI